jgi:hypothetical protein
MKPVCGGTQIPPTVGTISKASESAAGASAVTLTARAVPIAPCTATLSGPAELT